MNIETILIIILSVLTLALGLLLYIRIQSQKRQMGVIRRMNLAEFSEFLRTNSQEGNIQAIASRVSTFLSKTFGCNRIIFLRKKRGTLELNYYQGISGFNRCDFQIPFNNKLEEKLSKEFLPMKLEGIKSFLPAVYYEHLCKYKVDVYFPVYWRHNLYGLYFVNSNKETRSAAFILLIASLAHSLSAAYHIKWHESKYSDLEKKQESIRKPSPKENKLPGRFEINSSEIMPLLKLRDTNLLVPRIINTLGESLNLKKFTFSYETEKDSKSINQISRGLNQKLEPLQSTELRKLSDKIKRIGPQSIYKLENTDVAMAGWLTQLKESGLNYVAAFPLRENGEGVLAWSGNAPSNDFLTRLKSYNRLAADLVENAEAYQLAELMSNSDALTGLSNQRYMYKRLEEEINRAKRYNRPLAFIIFDIDELKNINDSFGHQAGDALIKQVGQAVKNSIRAMDIVARYGGDEFCVVMPESDQETCVKFMQRMLDKIASIDIMLEGHSKPIRCSVSMGGALYPVHAQDPKKLIYAADMALLAAKEGGRNRLLIYAPKEQETGG